MEDITVFDGDYKFLSNFYFCGVRLNGVTFPSAEHAYQAMKCSDENQRKAFVHIDSPGRAKRNGRLVDIRPDWEKVKKRVMLAAVMAKFTQNEDLAVLLTATGGRRLVEGNSWHDNYWGSCFCDKCASAAPEVPWPDRGLNYLGQTLMFARLAVRPD